jgi:hypothetical protein
MFTKSQRLVLLFGGWTFLVLELMALFNDVSLEYFVMLCLTGQFVIVELSGPYLTKPRWLSRINLAVAIGALFFGALVIHKVLVMLNITLR